MVVGGGYCGAVTKHDLVGFQRVHAQHGVTVLLNRAHLVYVKK